MILNRRIISAWDDGGGAEKGGRGEFAAFGERRGRVEDAGYGHGGHRRGWECHYVLEIGGWSRGEEGAVDVQKVQCDARRVVSEAEATECEEDRVSGV